MPKLCLLGGETVFKRSAMEINERAFRDAGEPLAVLVFPWARPSFDRKYIRRKRLVDYFKSLGANTVDFIEYSDSQNAINQKIANSNLIYLTGGQVSILLERLRKMKVDSLLMNFQGVIVGRSAGALALCKKCFTTIRSSKKVKSVNGLGLFPFTVKVHYAKEKDNELENLSYNEKIYCVPSGSAIFYDNGIISCVGEIYVFENGQKKLPLVKENF